MPVPLFKEAMFLYSKLISSRPKESRKFTNYHMSCKSVTLQTGLGKFVLYSSRHESAFEFDSDTLRAEEWGSENSQLLNKPVRLSRKVIYLNNIIPGLMSSDKTPNYLIWKMMQWKASSQILTG